MQRYKNGADWDYIALRHYLTFKSGRGIAGGADQQQQNREGKASGD
jgi:hypothetical protein